VQFGRIDLHSDYVKRARPATAALAEVTRLIAPCPEILGFLSGVRCSVVASDVPLRLVTANRSLHRAIGLRLRHRFQTLPPGRGQFTIDELLFTRRSC